jgi:hypothetical protein
MGKAAKRLAINTASNLFQQTIYMAKGFIVPLAMINVYGSETNGLIMSVNWFVYNFLLIEAGLSAAVIFSLYSPMVNRDYGKVNVILSTARRMYNRIGLWFLGLVVAGASIYPLIINSDSFSYQFVAVVFLLTGAAVSLEFFTLRRYSALLQADNRAYVLNLTLCLHAIIQTAAVLVFSYFRISVLWILAAILVSYFARSGILAMVCGNRYKFTDLSLPSDESLLSMRKSAFIHQISNSVAGGAPIVIATVLLPLTKVSVMSVYLLVIDAVSRILNSTGSVSQTWGRFIASGDAKRFSRSFSHFEHVHVLCLTLFCSVTAAAIEPFILVYTRSVSDKVEYAAPVFAMLCAAHLFMSLLGVNQIRLIYAAGLFDQTKAWMIIKAVLTVVFSAVLGYFFELSGIIGGVILANICNCAYLLFAIPHKCGLKRRETAVRWAAGLIVFAVLSLGLPHIIRYTVSLGYRGWMLSSAACLAIALPVTVIVFFAAQPKMFMDIWKTRVFPTVEHRFGKGR